MSADVWRVSLIGMPKAQARPRKGYAGHIYSPKDNWFYALYGAARKVAPKEPLDAPVQLDITYIFFRTPSVPKTKFWKDTKPDIDNAEKVVLDTLKNAGWFFEDSRVCVVHQRKRFTIGDEDPGVVVEMRELSHQVPCEAK